MSSNFPVSIRFQVEGDADVQNKIRGLNQSVQQSGSTASGAAGQVDRYGQSVSKAGQSAKTTTQQTVSLGQKIQNSAAGFSLAASSAVALWSAYDNVTDAAKKVEIAEDKVEKTRTRLIKAQERLVELQHQGGEIAEQLAIEQQKLNEMQKDGDTSAEDLAKQQEKVNDLQHKGEKNATDLAVQQRAVSDASNNLEAAQFRLTNAQEDLNKTWVTSATSVIPSVFTGVSGLGMVFKGLAPSMSGAAKAAGTGRGGFAGALGLLTSPLGIIIGIIGGVVAAIWALRTNFMGVRDAARGFVDWLKEVTNAIPFARQAIDWLVGGYKWLEETLFNVLGNLPVVGDMFGGLADKQNGAKHATDLFRGGLDSLRQALAGLPEKISEVARTLWDGLVNSADQLYKTFTDPNFFRNAINGITDLFTQVGNALRPIGEPLWGGLVNTATWIVTTLQDPVFQQNFLQGLLDFAQAVQSLYTQIGEVLWGGLVDTAQWIYTTLTDPIFQQKVADGFNFIFSNIWSILGDIGSAVWGWLVNTASWIYTTLTDPVFQQQLKDGIIYIFGSTAAILQSIGQTLWTGLTNTATWIYNTLTDPVFQNQFTSGMNWLFGTVAATLGPIGQTLWTGLTNTATWISTTLQDPVFQTQAVNGITSFFGSVAAVLGPIGQTLWTGLTNTATWIYETLKDPVFQTQAKSGITWFFGTVASVLGPIGQTLWTGLTNTATWIVSTLQDPVFQTQFKSGITYLFGIVASKLGEIGKTLWDGLKNTASYITSTLSDPVFQEAFKQGFTKGITGLGQWLYNELIIEVNDDLFRAIKELPGKVAAAWETWDDDLGAALGTALGTGGAWIIQALDASIKDLPKNLTNIGNQIGAAIGGAMITGLSDPSAIPAAVGALPGEIQKSFADQDFGTAFTKALTDSFVKAGGPAALNAFVGDANSLLTWINKGITDLATQTGASISKAAGDFANYIKNGFIDIVKRSGQFVVDSITGTSNSLLNWINKGLTDLPGKIGESIKGLPIGDIYNGIVNLFKKIDIGKALTDAFGSIGDALGKWFGGLTGGGGGGQPQPTPAQYNAMPQPPGAWNTLTGRPMKPGVTGSDVPQRGGMVMPEPNLSAGGGIMGMITDAIQKYLDYLFKGGGFTQGPIIGPTSLGGGGAGGGGGGGGLPAIIQQLTTLSQAYTLLLRIVQTATTQMTVAWTAHSTVVGGITNTLIQQMTTYSQGYTLLLQIIQAATTQMTIGWTGHMQAVTSIISSIASGPLTLLGQGYTLLLQIVQAAVTQMAVAWAGHSAAVTAATNAVIAPMTTLGQGYTLLLQMVQAATTQMTLAWVGHGQALSGAMGLIATALSNYGNMLSGALNNVISFTTRMTVAWVGHGQGVGQAISGPVSSALSNYGTLLSGALNNVTSATTRMSVAWIGHAGSVRVSTENVVRSVGNMVTRTASHLANLAGIFRNNMSSIVRAMNQASQAARNLQSSINNLHGKVITVTTRYVTQGRPGGGVSRGGATGRAAKGFSGVVNQPTRLFVGEGNKPELVQVTPLSRAGGRLSMNKTAHSSTTTTGGLGSNPLSALATMIQSPTVRAGGSTGLVSTRTGKPNSILRFEDGSWIRYGPDGKIVARSSGGGGGGSSGGGGGTGLISTKTGKPNSILRFEDGSWIRYGPDGKIIERSSGRGSTGSTAGKNVTTRLKTIFEDTIAKWIDDFGFELNKFRALGGGGVNFEIAGGKHYKDIHEDRAAAFAASRGYFLSAYSARNTKTNHYLNMQMNPGMRPGTGGGGGGTGGTPKPGGWTGADAMRNLKYITNAPNLNKAIQSLQFFEDGSGRIFYQDGSWAKITHNYPGPFGANGRGGGGKLYEDAVASWASSIGYRLNRFSGSNSGQLAVRMTSRTGKQTLMEDAAAAFFARYGYGFASNGFMPRGGGLLEMFLMAGAASGRGGGGIGGVGGGNNGFTPLPGNSRLLKYVTSKYNKSKSVSNVVLFEDGSGVVFFSDGTRQSVKHNSPGPFSDRSMVRAANGFSGVVNGPTRFLAGEAGSEFVNIQPLAQGMGRKGGGVGGRPVVVQFNIRSELDGRVISETVRKELLGGIYSMT